ncbi:MAG: hypothetical protein AAFU74_00945 [Bacteroidota bacterium]
MTATLPQGRISEKVFCTKQIFLKRFKRLFDEKSKIPRRNVLCGTAFGYGGKALHFEVFTKRKKHQLSASAFLFTFRELPLTPRQSGIPNIQNYVVLA